MKHEKIKEVNKRKKLNNFISNFSLFKHVIRKNFNKNEKILLT